MKSLLVLSSSVLICAIPMQVWAADVLVPTVTAAPQVVVAPQAYDWSGFYVGVNGGIAGGTFLHPFSFYDPITTDVFVDGSLDVTSFGFVGGAQAGYNVQWGNFVAGIEADIQLSDIRAAVGVSAVDVAGVIGLPGDTLSLEAATQVDWFGTIRPRVGFAHDDALFYLTGGLAYGDITSSIDADLNGTSLFSESESNSGWGFTVGAGAEFAVNDNLTVKGEYLYTDLGEHVLFDAGGISLSNDVAFHTVRVGLNVSF